MKNNDYSNHAEKKELLGDFLAKSNNFDQGFDIIISHEEKFYGVRKFDKTKLNKIPHNHADGISALRILHDEAGKKILKYPKGVNKIEFKWTWEFISDLFSKHWTFFFKFPYKYFNYKEKIGIGNDLFAINLTQEQTKNAIKKSKSEGMSVNSYLIWVIYNKTKHLFDQSNWLIQ